MNPEQRIFEIGSAIINSAKKYKPGLGSTEQINNLVFQIFMNDPITQRQLLRFIDVLPALKNGHEIVSHVKEYLLDEKVQLPFLGFGTKFATVTPNLVANAINAFARKMAGCFFAGENILQTYETITKIKENNISFTLDILGEKTTSEKDAERSCRNYLEALNILAEKFGLDAKDEYGNPLINISVKISSLYSRFDPIDHKGTSEAVKNKLRTIFRKSMEIGASINVDLEDYQTKEITYHIFENLLEEDEFKNFKNAGLVVQAYLKDSGEIVNNIIKWSKKNEKPITVRLVKGAYWDHEVMLAWRNGWDIPVFTKKWQSDVNFEKLTGILLENSEYTHTAIATHNIRSMAYAIARQEELQVNTGNFEVQMLYGMGNEIKFALLENNIPLRLYTPYGELLPGMSYFVRRLLENSANQSFLRAFDKNADPNMLLKNPAECNHDSEDTLLEQDMPKESRVFNFIKSIFSGKHKNEKTEYSVNKIEHESEFNNSKLIDFSKPENRAAMESALSSIHKKFGSFYFGINIGGKWIDTENYITSRNPSKSSEIIGTVSKAGREHIVQAILTAKKAFNSWRHTSVKERSQYLYNAAKKMNDRIFELAALIVYEAGKTWREATADVNEAVDFLNFYSNEMLRLGRNRLTQNIPGEDNTVNYIPKGIVAVISPWNFPLAILTGMTSASIVTGNTVIMKPSSDTPLIAGELMKLFQESGLPDGVLNYVPGSGDEAGDYLITSPDVDMIAFTGSRETGLGISKAISEVYPGQVNVKTAILEMGGKNGIIIDTTADIDEAIPGVLYSAFGFQGQKCSACSRVIVSSSIYKEFVDKLVESAKSLRVGSAELSGADTGPVINKKAFEKISNYIESAKKEGGNVLLEGICSNSDGFYIGPTIIEVNSDNIIAKEEIFGPVLSVLKADDIEEAIDLLNSTDYALTGGIYSRTPSHIEMFKSKAEAGNCYINRGITGAIVERQPFGGYKMSGAGSKAGGMNYLLHFMFQITYCEETRRKGYIPDLDKYSEEL